MEVNQGNQEEVEVKEEVTIPDVVGSTLAEAEKIFKEYGIEMKLNNESEDLDKSSAVVKSQTPQPGITVFKGSNVFIEY